MDVLLCGDTVCSPQLRHELPVAIIDELAYAEHDGRAYVAASLLERADVKRVRPDAAFVPVEDLGVDELVAEGVGWEPMQAELALRLCRRVGIARAAVPPSFPLGVADVVRAGGVELVVDAALFDGRRRAKTAAELAGIRRAARAAERAARAIAMLLAAGTPGDDGLLRVEGEVLEVARLRTAAEDAARALGARLDGSIVAPGAQAASGHDLGSGPVRAGDAVVVDLWPQDRASGCFADFTRTFVAGALPDEEIVVWHGLCRDALARVLDATAPGVTGRDLWEVACDVFEAAGQATQRTKRPGEVLDHGFFHSLGHGVGLQVHEEPALGRSGTTALVPGDVIAIEPGLYRPGFGGVRVEETVLVTDDGHEVLTAFDHELRI
jgi:Xaa-Pro aminopeptidase